MPTAHITPLLSGTRVSPLVLADRLLSLAQDADRAGFAKPAARLLQLAYSVYDEMPHYC